MEHKSTKAHWETYWKQSDHQPVVVHEEMLKNIEEVMNVKGKRILEVGAGMGGDSIYLAKRGARVAVLDFTQEALDAVRLNAKKEKVSVELVKADAKEIPFPDETFDLVFHQGFLEHFTSPLEMVLEQKRVLKKDGYIVIDVPQRYTMYTIKKHIQMWTGKWFAGWEREFSMGELEKLMRKEGLMVKRRYGWGYYGKLHTLRHLSLGATYERLWKSIEKSRIKFYLSWCIGIIAQKNV